MTLNKLFLGGSSVADITTVETTDEIEMKLATRYQTLLTFLIMLARTRKKVDEMRDEIDRVLSNAR